MIILAAVQTGRREKGNFLNVKSLLSKPILIGFFLALTFGSVVRDQLHTMLMHVGFSNVKFLPEFDADDKRLLMLPVLCSILPDMERPVQNSPDNPNGEDPDNAPSGLWLLMISLLLVISLYTLFEVRRRQAFASQLAAVRADLLTLFNNTPCGFHSLDSRGVFLNINSTLLAWLGYQREEVINKLNFSDIVEGGEKTATRKLADLQHENSSATSLRLIKKSGEKMPVVLSRVKLQSADAGGKQLYCTIDNTECHQALERISNLDQELEAFSYSISHDLRAPLRSIDGYSKILQEDYAGNLDEEGKRVLNVIMSNAKRMGKLIDDLLEFGRLGRKNIQRANVDMAGLAKHIAAELQSQEPNRKIDVHVGELHAAYGDADMIRQLWYNLLDNAFKYSGKKEVAVIDVRSFKSDQGEICYEVSDNGVGFDMKYEPKLFGVFQRLHKIQDFTGTGVGLAMVKRIVTRHGGRVWAEGSLNEGAKFYFTLPIENENT